MDTISLDNKRVRRAGRRIRPECEKQFYKGNYFNFAMTLVSILLTTIMSVGLAFILQYFVEAVEFADSGILKKGGMAVVVFLLCYFLCSILNRNFKNTYMRKALAQFKDYVFEKMLGKSISQYENGMSAQFLSAFSNDLNSIETNYLLGTTKVVLTVMMYVSAAGIMLFWNPVMAVPIIVASMVFMLLSLKYGEKLVTKENETSEENQGFVAQVKDLLNGFLVIKSFKAEKEVLAIFRGKNAELEDTKQGRRMTADTVEILGNVSGIVVNMLIFGMGFLMAFRGSMSLGMVLGFIQLGNYLVNPVGILASALSNRRAAIRLIERIAETLEKDETAVNGQLLPSFEKEIVFDNVSFGYDGLEDVLKGIRLRFEKGKSYAIVGGSGSGKSTLLKLMLGHNSGYTGNISIDGISVKEVSAESLYDRISIVQQDVFLFDNSIQDNITMFKQFDKKKVQNAVEKAGLASLMEVKGEGYLCGEGGRNLSGGEKQRISIARCLVRETPVLLMDEATAALDNETAVQVENAILDIADLTRIVVTHRFNECSLRKYDEIVVMGRGSLIEQGSFEKLMGDKGYFYSLYNVAQAE